MKESSYTLNREKPSSCLPAIARTSVVTASLLTTKRENDMRGLTSQKRIMITETYVITLDLLDISDRCCFSATRTESPLQYTFRRI
jgi:hypothetical protein